ncbi:MAG: mucoidy inhibitor MuiA family protein [Phycisphaerae bacterium]|jgi:uncharacterized protein (TIGR02231 family)|nr:mucoidy inhibitor MuiA family protein [Phycisphaerae bacterium]
MNNKVSYMVLVLAVLLAASTCPAQILTAKSSIESVTLYRGQALVTRAVVLPADAVAKARAAAGELEVFISDLPANIVAASLHADGGKGTTIRSVRYRTRAVAVEPKKEVAELDVEIKDISRQIATNLQMQDLLSRKTKYVEKLENFTSAVARDNAADRKIDLKTVTQMSDQIFKYHSDHAQEQIALKFKRDDLSEQLALLKRKRSELTKEKNRTIREAIVRLLVGAKPPASIKLSYLVSSAGWSPAYNIRLSGEGKSVTIEYLAEAWQQSGEDWSKVALTLSTATPHMNAKSPLLSPYWISLAGGDNAKLSSVQTFNKARGDNSMSQLGVLAAWSSSGRRDQMQQLGWELNRLAAEAQGMELNVKGDVLRAGAGGFGASAGLAVSYPLAGSMTLTSRPDKQLVQIKKSQLAVKSHHVAVPLLSTHVFRMARGVNTTDLPLLAGQYSAFVDGEFVGRANLPLVARGQPMNFGFGVDTQLRCRRELVDKSDRVSWGSRIQSFNYRLRIESFKDRPVSVRLLDRIPAVKSDDIKITLGKPSDKLSTDAIYARDLRPRGILRWDIELSAGASGTKARDVKYGFEMKFAKDKHIGQRAAGLMQKMRIDFNEMMLNH